MKNLGVAVICIAGLLFVSCGSDNEPTDSEEEVTTEISTDTEQELEDAEELQEEAIVLDAEVDEFIESL